VIGTLCLFEIHGIKQEGRGSMFVLFLSVTLKHPELQSISITHNTLCSCLKTAVYLFESQRINFPFGGRASMCYEQKYKFKILQTSLERKPRKNQQ